MSSTQGDLIHGGVTLTPPTNQRKLVEEAWERARAAKKRLIIQPVGAWSEQCFMFDDSLAQKGEDLKKRTDRAEYLVLDELSYDRGHALDWLPADLFPFLAIYLVDPAVGRSSFTIVTDVTDAGLLVQYLDLWFETDSLPAKLRQLVLNYSPEKTSIPFAHLVSNAAYATGYTDDLATTKAFLQSLSELKAKREDLFAGVDLDGIAIRSVMNQLSSGCVTIEQLQEQDPEWAERILSDVERVIEVLYYIPAATTARKHGFKAAAEIALKDYEAILPKLPKTPLPYFGTPVDPAGVQTKLMALQKLMAALAGTLTLEEANKWTEEVLAKNYQFFFYLEIPAIFHALGAYGRAADIVEFLLPHWSDFYTKVTDQMQENIDSAMASGNTEMAEKIKALLPYIKRIPGGNTVAQKKRLELYRQRAAGQS